VSAGSSIGEGLVERAEITSGPYLYETLDKVNTGHNFTSIFNTREQDVEVPNPVVNVVELKDHDVGETAVIGMVEQKKYRDNPGQSRG